MASAIAFMILALATVVEATQGPVALVRSACRGGGSDKCLPGQRCDGKHLCSPTIPPPNQPMAAFKYTGNGNWLDGNAWMPRGFVPDVSNDVTIDSDATFQDARVTDELPMAVKSLTIAQGKNVSIQNSGWQVSAGITVESGATFSTCGGASGCCIGGPVGFFPYTWQLGLTAWTPCDVLGAEMPKVCNGAQNTLTVLVKSGAKFTSCGYLWGSDITVEAAASFESTGLTNISSLQVSAGGTVIAETSGTVTQLINDGGHVELTAVGEFGGFGNVENTGTLKLWGSSPLTLQNMGTGNALVAPCSFIGCYGGLSDSVVNGPQATLQFDGTVRDTVTNEGSFSSPNSLFTGNLVHKGTLPSGAVLRAAFIEAQGSVTVYPQRTLEVTNFLNMHDLENNGTVQATVNCFSKLQTGTGGSFQVDSWRNYGEAMLSGLFCHSFGTTTNYGTLTLALSTNGAPYSSVSGTIVNYGTLQIEGDAYLSVSSIENHGMLKISAARVGIQSYTSVGGTLHVAQGGFVQVFSTPRPPTALCVYGSPSTTTCATAGGGRGQPSYEDPLTCYPCHTLPPPPRSLNASELAELDAVRAAGGAQSRGKSSVISGDGTGTVVIGSNVDLGTVTVGPQAGNVHTVAEWGTPLFMGASAVAVGPATNLWLGVNATLVSSLTATQGARISIAEHVHIDVAAQGLLAVDGTASLHSDGVLRLQHRGSLSVKGRATGSADPVVAAQ